MSRPGRFNGSDAPPSTEYRQAMNALRRGDAARAAELFARAGRPDLAAKCRRALLLTGAARP